VLPDDSAATTPAPANIKPQTFYAGFQRTENIFFANLQVSEGKLKKRAKTQ